jgi:hypothetical protein
VPVTVWEEVTALYFPTWVSALENRPGANEEQEPAWTR